MTHSFDGYNYLIRLEKGEKLVASLQQFAAQTAIDVAWVNGLGGALEAAIGYYDLDAKEYRFKTIPGPLEVTAIQGNIALDQNNKIILHLHGTFTDTDCQATGGHIQDLTVAATLELFIHKSYQPIRRKHDDAVGLPLLDLD